AALLRVEAEPACHSPVLATSVANRRRDGEPQCRGLTRAASASGRLEQEFTSLAAQREAFIRSQRNDLSGMRDAAALVRCTLAALCAAEWPGFDCLAAICSRKPRQARAGYRRRGREQSPWQYWPAWCRVRVRDTVRYGAS